MRRAPGRAQAGLLAHALAQERPLQAEHGGIDLHAAPSGGHVVLFSDFLGDLDAVELALALASARTMRGILVQVLDPVEEEFPFDGRTRFESMSGHLSFETLRAADLRDAYRDRLAARKDRLAALRGNRAGMPPRCTPTAPRPRGCCGCIMRWVAADDADRRFWLCHPVDLWALAALPILWWLLRAVPPAPVRRRFPGIALLLGLRKKTPKASARRGVLLRVAALAALIVALAGPVLNLLRALPGEGPLLVVMDASWASARDWPRRVERAGRALDEAQRAGRTAAVVTLTDPPIGAVEFRAADQARERLPGLSPRPGRRMRLCPVGWAICPQAPNAISDGLARDGRTALLDALVDRGAVQVFQPETPVYALAPATYDGESVRVTARRIGGVAQALTLLAIGRDPAGAERDLARAPL